MTKLQEALAKMATAIEVANNAAEFAPVMRCRIVNKMSREYICRRILPA